MRFVASLAASRATPLDAGTTSANAAVQPQSKPSQLRTIALVTAMSTGGYRVVDAGAQSCPDGSAGKHLSLFPYADPKAHPLTDVTIALQSNRFCSMHFNYGASSIASFTGGFRLALLSRVDGAEKGT